MTAKDGDLRARLLSLPLELFIKIFDETFTSPPAYRSISTNATGDVRHTMPRIMHVSRATRTKYAQSYYSNSAFVFSEPYACFAWLCSVPAEYRKLVHDVRYVASDAEMKDGRAVAVRMFWSSVLLSRLEKHLANVLRVQSVSELAIELNGEAMLDEWTP